MSGTRRSPIGHVVSPIGQAAKEASTPAEEPAAKSSDVEVVMAVTGGAEYEAKITVWPSSG